jgi:hypothetical protein
MPPTFRPQAYSTRALFTGTMRMGRSMPLKRAPLARVMWLAGDRNFLVNGKVMTGLLELTTNTPLAWSKEMHVEQGDICMADGSVQQFSNSRLAQSLRSNEQEVGTNYLSIP